MNAVPSRSLAAAAALLVLFPRPAPAAEGPGRVRPGAVRAELVMTLRGGLDQPTDVAVAADGRAYVLDGVKGQVVVFDRSGRLLRSFGRPGSGPGGLRLPMALTVAGGELFVADTGNSRIAVFDLDGRFSRELVLAGGPGRRAEPVGVAVSEGRLFWTGRAMRRLCAVDATTGKRQWCAGGSAGGRPGGEKGRSVPFGRPFALAADRAGYVFAADALDGRIRFFSRRGRLFGSFADFGLGPGRLMRPGGLAFGPGGELFVSDSQTGLVSLYVGNVFAGHLLKGDGSGPVLFTTPVGLDYSRGLLYVADAGDGDVKVLRLAGGEMEPVGTAATGGDRAPSRKGCAACHISWAPGYEAWGGDGVADAPPPVAAERTCYACHYGSIVDSRLKMGSGLHHPSLPAEKKSAPMDEGVNGAAPPPLWEGNIYCGTCHSPHDAQAGSGRPGEGRRWMRGDEERLCGACHDDRFSDAGRGDGGRRGGNHPVGIALRNPREGEPLETEDGLKLFASSARLAEGLPQGLLRGGARLDADERMVCASCHVLHRAPGKGLLAADNSRSSLCMECHDDKGYRSVERSRREGVHPLGVGAARAAASGGALPDGAGGRTVECSSCHSAHGGRPSTPLLRKGLDDDELCADCHYPIAARGKDEARVRGVHPTGVTLGALEGRGGSPVKLPVELEQAGARLGSGGTVVCATCHSLHKGRPSTALVLKDMEPERLCVACHERQRVEGREEARRRGVHPMGMEPDEPVRLLGEPVRRIGCLTCHSVHGGERNTPSLRKEIGSGGLCVSCHGAEAAVAGTAHDLRLSAPRYRNRTGETAAQAGLCGSCHSIHDRTEVALPVEKAPLELPDGEPEAVARQAGEYAFAPRPPARRPGGALPSRVFERGTGEAPAGGSPPGPYLFAGPSPPGEEGEPRDRLCLACHGGSGPAAKKKVERYGHPRRSMVLSSRGALPLFDGKGEARRFGRLLCVTCHDPHRWRPLERELEEAAADAKRSNHEEGDVRASFLRESDVRKTFCVDCHGPEAIVKFKYFHDVAARPGLPSYLEEQDPLPPP